MHLVHRRRVDHALRVEAADEADVVHTLRHVGIQAETPMPQCPCFLNSQGDDRIGVLPSVNWLAILPKLSGSFWPSYFFSRGLGSKVSIWLGAPTMNRKMTDFALAGKCGGFAASGLTRARRAVADQQVRSAIAPKPWAASRRTLRRVLRIVREHRETHCG